MPLLRFHGFVPQDLSLFMLFAEGEIELAS